MRHSRTWAQITSRHVKYSDAGLTFEGPVVRPDATNIRLPPCRMEVGNTPFSSSRTSNFPPGIINSQQDVVPYSERVTRVQEFSLDYPLPPEAMQTSLIDFVLGTTADPWQPHHHNTARASSRWTMPRISPTRTSTIRPTTKPSPLAPR